MVKKGVDGRDKRGHDDGEMRYLVRQRESLAPAIRTDVAFNHFARFGRLE
jgi:hypothetical protein